MVDHSHPNFPSSLSITPNIAHFANNDAFGVNKDIFVVEAQRDAILRYGIAGRVWEGAYVLCAYIRCDEVDPPLMDLGSPLGVIELGSGTGMVAACIANAIRRTAVPCEFIIATDLPDVCPLLHHNLGIPSHTPTSADPSKSDVVFVRPLVWGNLAHATAIAAEFGFGHSPSRLTHIICSDLVYFPELLGPLLRTLIHLTSSSVSSGMSPKVIISYKIRSLDKETPFWTAFGLWFAFSPVLVRHQVQPVKREDGRLVDGSNVLEYQRQFETEGDSDRIFVFVAHRRPESAAWHVPESDAALMNGVGARGTMMAKGDDTFETTLFMNVAIGDTDE